MRALLSVSDKTGIVGFGKTLLEAGLELVSTGGTHEMLTSHGLTALHVSEVTGFPELLNGRVRTLHPNIHAGILARRDVAQHLTEIQLHNIALIDLVCVNLYPFVQTVNQSEGSPDDIIENIDIGGPALLRAAAKNFASVIVLVDPADYEWVASRIAGGENISELQRKQLAQKAFSHVSCYDAAIACYLEDESTGTLPQELPIGLHKLMDLRYGENPHQSAAFYAPSLGRWGIAEATQLSGKELSYNNIVDADAAWKVVAEFEQPAVAVVKHTNPCGLAVHNNLLEAYKRAYQGDPTSAFGGIVSCNQALTLDLAKEMSEVFYEVIIAPEFESDALRLLQSKKNLRLLAMGIPKLADNSAREMRQLGGGILLQTQDSIRSTAENWQTVTSRTPTKQELRDLTFAWKASLHIKSNAIVLVSDQAIIGMGAGQPNRVNSVQLAVNAAGERVKDTVMASDAFFPFPDGLQLAANAGVKAVVQPGGSIRDQQVIDAANEAGIAMVFTGVRHFRH